MWGTACLQIQQVEPPDSLTGRIPLLICGPVQHLTTWRGRGSSHLAPHCAGAPQEDREWMAHLCLGAFGELVDILSFNEVYSKDVYTGD